MKSLPTTMSSTGANRCSSAPTWVPSEAFHRFTPPSSPPVTAIGTPSESPQATAVAHVWPAFACRTRLPSERQNATEPSA